MEWQPIETAPKDGSFVLVTSEKWFGDCDVAGWHFGMWRISADPESCPIYPTHWMPLPPPPEAGK
jgi:hypothetical protein